MFVLHKMSTLYACCMYVRFGTNVQIHPPKLLFKMLPKLRSFVANVICQLLTTTIDGS